MNKKTFYDRVGAGEVWKDAIDKNLQKAHVILLLVSADFLASDYCYDVEMARSWGESRPAVQSEASGRPSMARGHDTIRVSIGTIRARQYIQARSGGQSS